jgi:SAM-dependent methyltransferase
MSGNDDIDAYIASLCGELDREEDGIWSVRSREPVHYPDEVRTGYAEIESTSFWFIHRNRCIVSVVRRFAPNGPILDIGGGNGAVALALRRAGYPVIVVEPGRTGAQVARARGLPVIRATFSSLGIADGALMAAGLFDVLEHIEDQAKALAGVCRALAAGGWLYLTVPALACLWSSEDNAVGHFRRYTVGSVQRALSETGFSVAFASYLFSPLVLPILVRRSLPSLFGRIGGRPPKVDEDHRLPDNAIGWCVGRVLAWEATRIERGADVPVGSSVVVAARKC